MFRRMALAAKYPHIKPSHNFKRAVGLTTTVGLLGGGAYAIRSNNISSDKGGDVDKDIRDRDDRDTRDDRDNRDKDNKDAKDNNKDDEIDKINKRIEYSNYDGDDKCGKKYDDKNRMDKKCFIDDIDGKMRDQIGKGVTNFKDNKLGKKDNIIAGVIFSTFMVIIGIAIVSDYKRNKTKGSS